jgi:hypothetical protein
MRVSASLCGLSQDQHEAAQSTSAARATIRTKLVTSKSPIRKSTGYIRLSVHANRQG